MAGFALLAIPGVASADQHVETVVEFDPALGQFPEGIAVDKTGHIYVSMTLLDQVWRISPDGTSSAVLSQFAPGTAPAGLTLAANGTLYVAAGGFDLDTGQTDPAVRGVYRVSPDGSNVRLPGTDAITFPNDLVLDDDGTLYVTDTAGGAVWRIPRGGSAEMWADHPLLDGDGSFGFGTPIGANGIAVWRDSVIVANPEKASLVTVPIQRNGTAGAATLLAQALELTGADGIALDVHGDIYVGAGVVNLIVRVSSDGSSVTPIATAADGLNQPSTIAFGTGMGNRTTLYAANFSIFVPQPTPGVLAVQAGVPGLPQP